MELTRDQLPLFEEILHKKIHESNADYKLSGELNSCLRGEFQRSFFVDEFPEFSAALSKSVMQKFGQESKNNIGYLSNVITCYMENEEGLKKLLLNVKEINWNEQLVFTGVQKFLPVLEEVVKRKSGKLEKEDCVCLHVTPERLPKFLLPNGYKLSKLTVSDAPAVSASWQYGSESEHAGEYIHWLIENYLSIAVHDNANTLVAYMIQCHNGSIGFLRVDPDHQRKGLAQVVVTNLAQKVIQSGQPAYVYIDNDISLKLHQKCGFEKLCDVNWVFYTPSYCNATASAKPCV